MLRKIAETVVFAFVGALIAPMLASFLANIIVKEINTVYAVPMMALAIAIVSFLISTLIKRSILHVMTINLNHVLIMGSIFVLQFFICSIFVFFGLNPVFALSVMIGSFVSLVITIIMRPFTAMSEIKDKIEEYQHPETKNKKR